MNDKLITRASYSLAGEDFNFAIPEDVFSAQKIDDGTRLLLEKIIKLSIKGRVLDFGCGCGVIGIVVAKLFAKATVTMIDIDKSAINSALENITGNHISNAQAYVFDIVRMPPVERYDFIFSNLPWHASKEKIIEYTTRFYEILRKNGEVAVVTKLDYPVGEYLKRIFGNCRQIQVSGNYQVLWAKKGLKTKRQ